MSNKPIDPQLINKYKVTINTSSSKQMYSFGKENRFRAYKARTDVFYNLPSTLEKRKAGFGYGTKSDFTKGAIKGKVDKYYDIPREFEVFRKNTPQYTMGAGREVCKMAKDINKMGNPGIHIIYIIYIIYRSRHI